MDDKTLGQVAYEAWAPVRSAYFGWELLSNEAQQSWENAAEAVRAQVVENMRFEHDIPDHD